MSSLFIFNQSKQWFVLYWHTAQLFAACLAEEIAIVGLCGSCSTTGASAFANVDSCRIDNKAPVQISVEIYTVLSQVTCLLCSVVQRIWSTSFLGAVEFVSPAGCCMRALLQHYCKEGEEDGYEEVGTVLHFTTVTTRSMQNRADEQLLLYSLHFKLVWQCRKDHIWRLS